MANLLSQLHPPRKMDKAFTKLGGHGWKKRVLAVMPHSQNNNSQFLPLLTVLILPCDEKEGSGFIKTELRITVLQLLDRVLFVASVVIVLVHHQHRIRPFLILEKYRINKKKTPTYKINQPKIPSQNKKF